MLKYIVVKDSLKRELIIVFQPFLVHREVADRFSDCEPLSAGFVTVSGGIECFGKSKTLFLKSRDEEDSILLKEAQIM